MKIDRCALSLTLLAVSFNIVDIASTEILLHHGSGSEANALVHKLHDDGGIWVFRTTVLTTIVAILLSCRLDESDYHRLCKKSAWQILRGKQLGLGLRQQFNLCMMIGVMIFSINRLIAGISNISGEILGCSIPMAMERLGWNGQALYTSSVLVSTILSCLALGLAWELGRRWHAGETVA